MAPWASVSLAWMLVTVGRLPAQGSLVGAGGADSFQLLPPPLRSCTVGIVSALHGSGARCQQWS